MKRLILVGGGHAQLSVLEALARARPAGVEAVLVTPSRFQIYSGMLPGWMAGHYGLPQCRIDLQPLAQSAHVQLVADRILGMDADRHCVRLPDGREIEYDLLSMDVGSEIDVSSLQMAREKLLPVKPLDEFFQAWPRILSAAREKPGYRLVVVGGGAAGVELALAARYAFTRSGIDGNVDLVVSESGLLAGHAAGVQRRIARFMAKAGVAVHPLQGTGSAAGVLLSDGRLLPADCVLAATGARAPRWLERSGLKLDANGYVAVDGSYRSSSHRSVFAAGDVSARQDIAVARSGVHAVHAGPVLAGNLVAALEGGSMRTYVPRRQSLYLLACGPRYAVASWGRWSAEGAWVWRWKDRIDRGFIRRFERPEERA
jgi:pyridine nucleotide-disulfide oxidoreductase family protein